MKRTKHTACMLHTPASYFGNSIISNTIKRLILVAQYWQYAVQLILSS